MQIKLIITLDCEDIPTRMQLENAVEYAERTLEQELIDVLYENTFESISTDIIVPASYLHID